ncbi:unnamed protein product [Urochloa humidicola]
MSNYLLVMLTKECRNWLGGLPRDSIDSWERLTELFTSNYHGTYERPGSKRLLSQLRQRKNETLREFIQRFSKKRNSIPFVDERDVITAFHRGIANGVMINRWIYRPPRTVNEMFTVANSWADGEEEEKEQLGEFRHRWEEESRSRNRRVDRDRAEYDDRREDARGEARRGRKRKNEADMVAALDSANGQMSLEESQKMLDMQCPYHKNHKHLARDCFTLRRAFRTGGNCPPQNKKDDCPPHRDREDPQPDDFQDADHVVNIIYGVPGAFESRRQQKLMARQVLHATEPPTPEYLRWSKVPITFSRANHSGFIPKPGRYALVVAPSSGRLRGRLDQESNSRSKREG